MLDWWSKYFASIETLTEVSGHDTEFFVRYTHSKIHRLSTDLPILQALKAQDAALSDSEEKDDVDVTDGRGNVSNSDQHSLSTNEEVTD